MLTRAITAAILVITSSSEFVAAKPRITSVYTKLDGNRCKTIEESDEGSYALERCPGYGGIPVLLGGEDIRGDISAGEGDLDNINRADAPSGPGDTIEWRLANGKPFAIIYRMTFDGPNGETDSTRLIVKTISTPQKPACQIAEIEGATPNANGIARAAADAWLAGKGICADPSTFGTYTSLTEDDWKRCKIIEHDRDSETRRCQGAVAAYAYDIPLFVKRRGDRYDLDAGVLDHDPLLPDRAVKLPQYIEWPEKDGPPFAMIYRLETVHQAGQKRWSHLMVESVGTPGKPGCRIAEIDGTRPNANTEARAAAETVLKGTAKCLYAH